MGKIRRVSQCGVIAAVIAISMGTVAVTNLTSAAAPTVAHGGHTRVIPASLTDDEPSPAPAPTDSPASTPWG
jgi:hypothetical protein